MPIGHIESHSGVAMKPSQLAIALLLSLCVTGVEGRSFSDTRLPVWSTLVTPLVKEPPGWTNEARNETRSLAFSPDDQRLAVAIAHDDVGFGRTLRQNAHVLIIDVHSPSANVRQFDLLDTCGSDLAWNASGNALLVCGRLLQPANGANCDASEVRFACGNPRGLQVFWLNAEHVVRSRTGKSSIWTASESALSNWNRNGRSRRLLRGKDGFFWSTLKRPLRAGCVNTRSWISPPPGSQRLANSKVALWHSYRRCRWR